MQIVRPSSFQILQARYNIRSITAASGFGDIDDTAALTVARNRAVPLRGGGGIYATTGFNAVDDFDFDGEGATFKQFAPTASEEKRILTIDTKNRVKLYNTKFDRNGNGRYGTIAGGGQAGLYVNGGYGHRMRNLEFTGDDRGYGAILYFPVGGEFEDFYAHDMFYEEYSTTVTSTPGTPWVISWTAHRRVAGSTVKFTGANVPSGAVEGTTYYVIAAGLTANSFEVSATAAGAAINTTGSVGDVIAIAAVVDDAMIGLAFTGAHDCRLRNWRSERLFGNPVDLVSTGILAGTYYGERATPPSVVSATATTIVFAGDASAVNDAYNGMAVVIVSGTGASQARTIDDYVGSTRTATILDPWFTNPDTTSKCLIRTPRFTRGISCGGGTMIDMTSPMVSFVDQGVDVSGSAGAGLEGHPGLSIEGGILADCTTFGLKYANKQSRCSSDGVEVVRAGAVGIVFTGPTTENVECHDPIVRDTGASTIWADTATAGISIGNTLASGFPKGVRVIDPAVISKLAVSRMAYGVYSEHTVADPANPNVLEGEIVIGATVADVSGAWSRSTDDVYPIVRHQGGTPASISTAGAATYTAANILTGTIIRDPAGGSRTDVLPTAALLLAAVPGAKIGTTIEFKLTNGADAAETITLDAGAGGTYDANQTAASRVIGQNQSKIIRIRFTNVTAASEAYVAYI